MALLVGPAAGERRQLGNVLVLMTIDRLPVGSLFSGSFIFIFDIFPGLFLHQQ